MFAYFIGMLFLSFGICGAGLALGTLVFLGTIRLVEKIRGQN